ncbi:MAG TPA: YqaJ viral recombinase family protein [Thermoanaerobaculia bacterium]|nr:YqaJ viral recombinase family protein [Thermoanaerobaculia bacterium]
MSLLSAERIDIRSRNVGSSEVAALFGLDERRTLFELWHQKAGQIPEPDASESERGFWGTVLEPAIAQGIAERRGWKIRKVRRYVEHPAVPGMGASLDFEIYAHPRGAAPLEIKNVDWTVAQDWPEGLPPLRFELQVQHRLACLPSRPWAALGVLIGGHQPEVFEYDRHPGAIARIEREVAAFWRSIEENRPPEPDFERDLPALEILYGTPRPGTVLDLRGDRRLEALCAQYESARVDKAVAEGRKRAAKAGILSVIRDAETAYCEGFKILAPARPGGEVSFHRKPCRDFRVFVRGSREES